MAFVTPDKETIHRARTYPMALAIARFVAPRCGYALCEHGTKGRDLDLVAVPWTDEAMSAEAFVKALGDEFTHWGLTWLHAADDYPLPRRLPHGRLCWPFHFGGGPYLDLSVMPRMEPCPGHRWWIGKDQISRCRRCKLTWAEYKKSNPVPEERKS